MQIERQPQTRLKNQVTHLGCAQDGAVRRPDAAEEPPARRAGPEVRDALGRTSRRVDVNDATKAAVSLHGAAGHRQLLSSRRSSLARGAQRWYAYTQSASDQTITYSNGDTTHDHRGLRHRRRGRRDQRGHRRARLRLGRDGRVERHQVPRLLRAARPASPRAPSPRPRRQRPAHRGHGPRGAQPRRLLHGQRRHQVEPEQRDQATASPASRSR